MIILRTFAHKSVNFKQHTRTVIFITNTAHVEVL